MVSASLEELYTAVGVSRGSPCSLGEVGPHGRVLAFEPFRPLFQLLTANVVLNGLTHVETFPDALGAREETLHVAEHNYANAGTRRGSGRKSIDPCSRLPIAGLFIKLNPD